MKFFAASKLENVKYISQNIRNIRRFYGPVSYSIIVPDREVVYFSNYFQSQSLNDINIISEDSYITLEDFRNMLLEIANSFQIQDLTFNRINWYYTQVLSLTYTYENAKKEKVVLIDGDTILIRKMRFFNDNHSNIFYTPYENNLAYKESCEDILCFHFDNWTSATSQLFSMTPFEWINFNKRLSLFLEKSHSESISNWIARIILTSVLRRKHSINGNYFSNMDLVSANNLISGSKNTRKILFLRSGLQFQMTPLQIKIAAMLGFWHITYEQWQIKDENKTMDLAQFIKILIIYSLPYMNSNLYKILKFFQNIK